MDTDCKQVRLSRDEIAAIVDSRPSLMRGAEKHEPRSSTLDVDVVRVLADLDRIEAHSERQRPTEGDDQRDRIRRAAMVLSEYVIQHGDSA